MSAVQCLAHTTREVWKCTQQESEDKAIAQAIKILTQRLNKHSHMPVLNSTTLVANFLTLQFAQLDREQFGCLFLHKHHHLICYETLFVGTIGHCSVYPREVVKRALFHNATGIVMVHNHPSGSGKASEEDIKLTHTLRDTLKLVDVVLQDHIIVHGQDTYSMRHNALF